MPAPPPRTPLQAVSRRRFPLTSWPWRSAGYLLTTPLALAAAVPLGLLAVPWAVLLRGLLAGNMRLLSGVLLFLLGAGLLVTFGPLVAVPMAVVERWRLRLIDHRPVASGHRRPPAAGLWPWLRTRYAEPATWRELGYSALLVTAVPVLYGLTLAVLVLIAAYAVSPLLAQDGPVSLGAGRAETVRQAVPYALAGLALLPTVPYLLALAAGAHGAAARALLQAGSGSRLRAELIEMSRSRARLVDAFEAERRRIERDLHDGAQQRLVGLTLQLGLARLDLPDDSPAARSVITAHQQAKQLMTELRELIHGIQPQILTDLGLPAALRDLAGQATVPVTVHTEVPQRPSGHLEATAYFVVAEALTNVAKHSGATGATVTARQEGGTLVIEVGDDGHGGADPQRGTGLTGLTDRVAVADGKMFLSSPPGGPTLIRVELPCPQS